MSDSNKNDPTVPDENATVANFTSGLDEPTYEIIYDDIQLTPWDIARDAARAAESRLADTDLGSPQHAAAKKALDDAQARVQLEIDRDSDPTFRYRRNVDDWRSGEGRDQYNASRRMVRKTANADLSGMNADQKEAHEKARKSDNSYATRARARGDTPKQIETELVKRRADRNKLQM